jgi:CheY-like chemotaxis protein
MLVLLVPSSAPTAYRTAAPSAGEALAACTHGWRTLGSAPSVGPSPDRGPRRGGEGRAMLVLVVDDDPGVREVLAQALEEELGARVVVAVSGEDALARVREERPGLVLLDLRMPGMDGAAFCRRVRADPRSAGIPVVAVTALPAQEGRAAALAAGCDAHLAKPFDLDDVFALVRRFRRAS